MNRSPMSKMKRRWFSHQEKAYTDSQGDFDRNVATPHSYNQTRYEVNGAGVITVQKSNVTGVKTTYQGSRTAKKSVNYWFLCKHGYPLPYNDLTYKMFRTSAYKGYKSISGVGYPQPGSVSFLQVGNFDDDLDVDYYSPFGVGVSSVTSSERAATDSRAAIKLHLAIKNQKVNIAQALAEREQTIRLIGGTATRVANSLRLVKQGKIAQAAKELGVSPPKRAIRRSNQSRRSNLFNTQSEISRRWLELQYGWKPLLSDIYGAMEVLATDRPKGEIAVHAKSTLRKDLSLRLRWPTLAKTAIYKGTAEYTRKYTVRFTVPYPEAQTLTALGLSNPAMIAWELMPWSFVIDWFLPLGNWINTFDSTIGCSFLEGCTTEVMRVTGASTEITYSGIESGSSSRLSGSVIKPFESLSIYRTKLLSFPGVGFPSFKSPLSVTHAANAMALLQLQRKK